MNTRVPRTLVPAGRFKIVNNNQIFATLFALPSRHIDNPAKTLYDAHPDEGRQSGHPAAVEYAAPLNAAKRQAHMTKFSDLELDPKVLQAIDDAGYETPTPIQAQAIPLALQGRDVLGIAPDRHRQDRRFLCCR